MRRRPRWKDVQLRSIERQNPKTKRRMFVHGRQPVPPSTRSPSLPPPSPIQTRTLSLELLEGVVSGVTGGEIVGERVSDTLVARVPGVITREGTFPHASAPLLVFGEGVAKDPRCRDENYETINRSLAARVLEMMREKPSALATKSIQTNDLRACTSRHHPRMSAYSAKHLRTSHDWFEIGGGAYHRG